MDESVLGNILGSLINNKDSDFLSGGNMIWILLFFFLFMFMGGNFGGGSRASAAPIMPPPNVATQSDVVGAAAWQNAQTKMDFLGNSINQLGYAGLAQADSINQNVSQQGADTRLQLCQGTNAITNGIANLGYAVNVGQQQIERSIDQVRYENAQNTCAITTNCTANTQKVLDKICEMETRMDAVRIAELTAANQALNLRLDNATQTANLVQALRPYPIPAYTVTSPYGGGTTGGTTAG